MNLLKSMIFALSIALVTACSNSGSSYSEFNEEQRAAIDAAQQFVRMEFVSDAVFDADGTIVEPTEVEQRYKVLQRFDSKAKDGYNFVYRIWVQKFPTGWEYGNLGIEDAGAKTVHSSNGRMKEIEQRNMTRQEDGKAGNVDYTIIKRNAPNYVRVYTPNRLTRDDVLAIYNQLKNEYETVQYSTSRNPNDDDYMAIMYGSVYEYDIDKITKLADY